MSRIDMDELLNRYLNGTATPQETQQVEMWLNHYGNPDSRWEQMDAESREQWLAGLFTDIQESASINTPKVVPMPPRRHVWRTIAAVAAVFAIFFTAYLEWPVLQRSLHPVQLTVLSVPKNEKKQIIIADGSTIRLNSGAKLEYPEEFNGKTREVYLSGEAYFDIRHDASKPFIIHTGRVITTVLGTAFNIKADNMLHTVVVTVTRGKVSVANEGQSLGVITPNQQISFNTVNHLHSQTDVDARLAIAWQVSDIHFNDITFAAAAAQLQQRFKVKITFANEKVKKCRFTGTAMREEKLDKILKVICSFNHATYQTKADGSIVIDGPGCE